MKKQILESLSRLGTAFLISFVLCVILLLVLGENPLILWTVFKSTLFTSFGLGYTLFYTTPLIFTGLAVALSYQGGLFNIGAEGQLYLGALGVIIVAKLLPAGVSPWVGIPLGAIAALTGGALCGWIAGFLKAKRGSHEVIVTIMLNFIVIAMVDYAILHLFRNPENQNPETFVISPGLTLPKLSDTFEKLGLPWFQSTPVNYSFFLALICSGLLFFFLRFTHRGFEVRALGQNARASKCAGIPVGLYTILVLAVSGGLAGMVGINEVMGNQGRLIQGFSPHYGFTGIAVALLARNNPIAIPFTAFLFGALYNGSGELEFLSDKVSKEFSIVFEGILISLVAGSSILKKLSIRQWHKRWKAGKWRAIESA